jgi:D-tagatose-1,6-bisphosphate aldolase subunit GatZ/KbaZ
LGVNCNPGDSAVDNRWLKQLKYRHLRGESGGLCAVCCSHPMVLAAAMAMAVRQGSPLLIEATSNQVNPSGGYTGMTPATYMAHIDGLARTAGLPDSRIIVGADHLGPHPWKDLPAHAAMQRTVDLVRAVVSAGFRKIHLDTAVCCADDPQPPLPIETVVARAVMLCAAAEAAAGDLPEEQRPLYVIGNEVPSPGGALDAASGVTVTNPGALTDALDCYQGGFLRAGLERPWERVTAVVVQPGVEFGDLAVAPYSPEKAVSLSAAHARLPEHMTFEIHAADYQSSRSLAHMVRDHFMLFKIGPCLTFALRETLYALADIEADWPVAQNRSRLRHTMQMVMDRDPVYWKSHYQGSPQALRFLKHYSYRDRIRYYWNKPEAMAAVERLTRNFEQPVPMALIRQYLPDLVPEMEAGALNQSARAIIQHRLCKTVTPYFEACGPFGGEVFNGQAK